MQLHEIKSTIELIELEVKVNEVSPWEMKNIINKYFGTNLPGQMFYNYVSKGFITATKNGEGKWMVKKSEGLRFAEKYSLRNLLSL